ncbi:MAG TPA: hypothetical protein VMU70_01140 [Candidatus Tyrphobacter sp.]|nr:hypothetical protein [Candidatus Tyrphobacter sp.]
MTRFSFPCYHLRISRLAQKIIPQLGFLRKTREGQFFLPLFSVLIILSLGIVNLVLPDFNRGINSPSSHQPYGAYNQTALLNDSVPALGTPSSAESYAALAYLERSSLVSPASLVYQTIPSDSGVSSKPQTTSLEEIASRFGLSPQALQALVKK